jgi:hypothetical protein
MGFYPIVELSHSLFLRIMGLILYFIFYLVMNVDLNINVKGIAVLLDIIYSFNYLNIKYLSRRYI